MMTLLWFWIRTVFYGEKGGQMGDWGDIVNEKEDVLCEGARRSKY